VTSGKTARGEQLAKKRVRVVVSKKLPEQNTANRKKSVRSLQPYQKVPKTENISAAATLV